MRTLKMQDGDLVYENGSFVFIEGAACLKQRLELSIRCDKKSWFLNPGLGVDWWSIYDQKYISDRIVRSEIERVLLDDSEVTEIKSIDISYDNSARKISIVWKVSSVYGEIEGSI